MKTPALMLVAALACVATTSAATAHSPGGKAGGTSTRPQTRCATLRKRHKPLPPRCKRHRPVSPPAPVPGGPPAFGTVAATIATGEAPATGDAPPDAAATHGVAYGEGAVWAINRSGLLRIDPTTNSVVARIAGPDALSGAVIVADGSVWYSSYGKSVVVRIDPTTNQIVSTIPVDPGPEGLAATPGAIWVASHYGWAVDRIDTATDTVAARIPVAPHQDCCGPQGIAATPGAIWTGIPALGKVARIDPARNAVVALIPAGSACGDLAADASGVWVTGSGCGGPAVIRIDATTNAVTVRGVGDVFRASGVAFANGSLYIGSDAAIQGVVRVDPATGKVTGEVAIEDDLRTWTPTLAYGAGALWVRGSTSVTRLNLDK
jgi:streptogramin lyase